MSVNPYNQVAYPTFPRRQTHPDSLAAVGTLFGMTVAPVARCRVLEIGCGDGGNLIPVAYYLPESRCTGVDLAVEPIAQGRETIGELGMENICLVAGDLRDIGTDLGEFDYIIAHGLYSWIHADARDRLLAVCRERLAPQGIAFVSYNAYPGGHERQMLREMMLYHTRDIEDPTRRVEQSRWLLQFLSDASEPWKTVHAEEVRKTLDRAAGSLYHDDLAETNDPIYFRDFVTHARRHGLQYLGEADPHEMFDPRGALDWLEGDIIEREQYMDFLKARRFRQTLLCCEEVPLRRSPEAELMERFLFAAPARDVEPGEIEGRHGVRITCGHEGLVRVVRALGDSYPLPLPFDDLVPYAGNAPELGQMLLALITSGFASFHVFDFPCEETVTAKPRASRLVRHQAAGSRRVTSACHAIVELDEVGRHLIHLLDGTREHQGIAQALAAIPGAPALEEIERCLPSSLQWMARMALLEG